MTPLFEVYEALKAIMQPHEEKLVPLVDTEGDYQLNTHLQGPNGKPIWFGGVQIKKNYVSYHLMPVYIHPALLDTISPALKKRMQGKSCFNFKKIEPALFAELAALTKTGLQTLFQAPEK